MAAFLTDNNEFSLLRLVPPVLRARDFRLYTKGGRRLVDLWQNGGAAILGHTPPAMLRELKNTASRGLYAPFPHFLEDRYAKALSRIFPGRVFRFYAAPPPELEILMANSSANGNTGSTAVFWRPFINPENPLAAPDDLAPIVIPVVPGIQGWRNNIPLGLCVLAIKPDTESIPSLPPSDFLSPVLLAVAARGIYDLIAAAPQRAKPVYPRIAKALKNSRERQGQWQCQGLYVSLRTPVSHAEWEPIFRCFLEAGFLLPPVSSHPAILPGILSPGEEAKLADLLG